MFEIESNIPLPEEPALDFESFYNSMENQKYRGHYERLMIRAKNRTLTEYSEKHHIIPKCLGGTNDESNYARLTAPEHYIAHQLLVVLFKGNYKLIHAAILMTSKSPDLKRSCNKAYSWLRKLRSESLMGKEVTAATRAKISKGHLGKVNGPHSEETNLKISESNKGKTCPDNTRLAVAEANRNRVFTDEMRQAIRERMTGRNHSEESRLLISKSNKGRPATPEAIARCYEMAKNNIGRKLSEKQIAAISLAHKGKTISEEHKAIVAEANRNRIVTEETRAKMSANRMGIRPSEETRAKRSASLKGRIFSEEHIERLRLAAKNKEPISQETRDKKSKSMKATLGAKKAVKEILSAWSCAI